MDQTNNNNTNNDGLIGGDVANDIAAAMNDQMSGSVTPPTVVTPSGPLPPEQNNSPLPAPDPAQPASADDLRSIKQGALTQLAPLVDHIDQAPEERFDTLMMMIRSSDDTSLIAPAYEAAQGIADEKRKAHALIDIVNEINYLTRPQDGQNAN